MSDAALVAVMLAGFGFAVACFSASVILTASRRQTVLPERLKARHGGLPVAVRLELMDRRHARLGLVKIVAAASFWLGVGGAIWALACLGALLLTN
jgi:hypothetical protein